MTILAVSTFFQVVFASMLVIAVMILWVAAIVDVFRSGASGWKIAAILVLILILPIVGPLLYLAFRKPDPAPTAEEVYMAQADLHREAARRPIGGPGMGAQ